MSRWIEIEGSAEDIAAEADRVHDYEPFAVGVVTADDDMLALYRDEIRQQLYIPIITLKGGMRTVQTAESRLLSSINYSFARSVTHPEVSFLNRYTRYKAPRSTYRIGHMMLGFAVEFEEASEDIHVPTRGQAIGREITWVELEKAGQVIDGELAKNRRAEQIVARNCVREYLISRAAA